MLAKEASVMKSLFGNLTAVLLLTASLGQSADQDQVLEKPHVSADYAKRRDQILPSPAEQSYRKILWRASVLHGLVDAQKKDRPLLILLMNGHPLGCT
jgi:hypothetical protein